MHWVVCFTLVFATAAFSVAGPSATVEVVLDGSASMNRVGVDESPMVAVVRESMVAIVAEAVAIEPGMAIGLRIAGGGPPTESLGACSATSLVIPVADPEADRWLRELDAVNPWGVRPLIASVLEGLGDLEPVSGTRRIVIVTSGDDECGLGPQQVAAALTAQEGPTELRMVGLGLDQDVADRFGAVPFRNAATAEEVLAALRWAVLDTEGDIRPTGALVLRFETDAVDPLVARVDLVDLAAGASSTRIVTGEARFDLPAGRYRLTVVPNAGPPHEFRDLLVPAETDTELELELRPLDPAAIDLGSDSVTAGTRTWIELAGTVPDRARVLFVDANGRAVAPAADPFQDDGWTLLPPMNGPLDLLLVGPVSNGLRPILARSPIITIAGAPHLTVPEDIGVDTELTVEWSGPQGAGDFVGLVPRGGDPTRIIACAATGPVSRATLGSPPVETELDLIYVVSGTLSVAARIPLQITAPLASVAAPTPINAGETIEVAWTGPENDEDFVSLAAMGSRDDAYIEWARVTDGNPTIFQGPESPGSFEVRYVDGRTGDALARTSIEVERVAIELAVPKTATSGMRIEIKWTGSGAPGDFLAIARPGARPQRFLDWSPTTVGSPLTLAAPTKPGTYEIRYLSAGGREILAHATLEIQP